jgi:hypothetical protein
MQTFPVFWVHNKRSSYKSCSRHSEGIKMFQFVMYDVTFWIKWGESKLRLHKVVFILDQYYKPKLNVQNKFLAFSTKMIFHQVETMSIPIMCSCYACVQRISAPAWWHLTSHGVPALTCLIVLNVFLSTGDVWTIFKMVLSYIGSLEVFNRNYPHLSLVFLGDGIASLCSFSAKKFIVGYLQSWKKKSEWNWLRYTLFVW